jgi:hypothetical protein
MYFKDYDNSSKILQFSLTDAVLQVASAVFTVKYLNLTQFVSTQEDIYFITYNVFNDFLIALRKSS